MTTESEALKQAAVEDGAANPFAVAYLQLCQVGYLPFAQIPSAVASVSPLNPGGTWRCAWGPAQDPDQSNLVYVATYDYGPRLPVLAVVVIRGTDADINDGWGIFEQIWEDLDVTRQKPLPWPSAGNALVARGTLDGLGVIEGLTFGGQEVPAFLTQYLGDPQNGGPVLIVTGHSLGGCLTTVVAPWLQVTLSQKGITSPIVPVTFAGPTAGNAAFGLFFAASFPYSLRFFNSLDIVPRAWWDLDGIETIYKPYGVNVPDLAWIAIVGFKVLMRETGVTYAQPPTNSSPLAGQFNTSVTGWYEQVGYQHHDATYMTLLGGASVRAAWSPPPVVRRVGRSELQARLGPARLLVARGDGALTPTGEGSPRSVPPS